MAVKRSSRRVAASRLEQLARRLLDASSLCAFATVSPAGRAHINTAYFAWSAAFDVVWLSAPVAAHSRNVRDDPSTAVAVYDSTQTWGRPDRGIQLFGTAREVSGRALAEAQRLYADRFPESESMDMSAYRFYRLRPRRLKIFDEEELGGGVFVTASVGSGGSLSWARTDLYRI
jgi:uncharacterized protein YhbP (UPF0306 family)